MIVYKFHSSTHVENLAVRTASSPAEIRTENLLIISIVLNIHWEDRGDERKTLRWILGKETVRVIGE
jgi:hypothetical protein